ncbi:MAG: ankyrin repeat domain-containing protein [Acidobacteria bacterium]|nr:ankyrin repeat domain-containing protein [Acidobacteriota bacterium]
MGIRVKSLGLWWLAVLTLVLPVVLLSVASLAAGGDLRLVEAVQQGDQQAVRALLAEQADVNTPQPDGATALAWATHRDDLETAELLIRAGADVNAANDHGVTPLSLACTNRNAAMAGKLLDAGADPNVSLWTGETVLMTCASAGSTEAVKLLLARGADVNAKETQKGQTALMWAVAGKHSEVARALVEHGADIHAHSKIHRITREPFTIPCTPEDPCLTGGTSGVNYGPSIHFRSSTGGFTPLLFAAQQGDLDSARILLEAGADVNEASPEDGSILVVATASGHQKLALFLLEQGADPNRTDGIGFTSLHYTLYEGLLSISSHKSRPTDRLGWLRPNMPELMKALLAYGADPNARIAKDFPPYDYLPIARSNGNNLPQMSQVGVTPFLLAAASADIGAMRILVEGGADPQLTTAESTTALMVAAGVAHEKRDRWSQQKEKSLQAVQLAVELGADVDATDMDGRTALHGAVFMGANAIIQFLAEKGANLEAKDMYGQTPLSIALGDPEGLVYRPLPGARRDRTFRELYRPQEETVELLVQLGATPFTGKYRDRSGE